MSIYVLYHTLILFYTISISCIDISPAELIPCIVELVWVVSPGIILTVVVVVVSLYYQ